MDETIITWSAVNFLTVVTMAILGFMALALLSQLARAALMRGQATEAAA